MKVGILKEIKKNEYRVSMTPSGVELLSSRGHTVMVEKGAGVGSGFSDEEYMAVGGVIVRF